MEIWEQYLKGLQEGANFAKGAVPTKQDALGDARKMIAELNAAKAGETKQDKESRALAGIKAAASRKN